MVETSLVDSFHGKLVTMVEDAHMCVICEYTLDLILKYARCFYYITLSKLQKHIQTCLVFLI